MALIPVLDVIARAIVAAALLLAAFLKIRDLSAFQALLDRYDATRRRANTLIIAVPLAEVVAASALISSVTAFAGSVMAVGLLGAFTTFLVVTGAAGHPEGCGCFRRGRESGARVLTRNGILLMLGVAVLMRGPAAARVGAPLAIAIATALAVVVIALWLDNRRLRRGLAAGDGGARSGSRPAPDFTLPALDGTRFSLSALWARGKATLLVFVDVDCAPCDRLLPDVARWTRDRADALSIVVVAAGGERAADKLDGRGLPHVALQHGREIADAYGVQATPGACLIDASGMWASDVAIGAPAIAALVERHTTVRLDATGTPRLMVFLRRNDELLPELLTHLGQLRPDQDASQPARVVIVSPDVTTGDTHLPVVTDAESLVARRFGATRTPSAVVVDQHGARASQLVVGAVRVRALALEMFQETIHA